MTFARRLQAPSRPWSAAAWRFTTAWAVTCTIRPTIAATVGPRTVLVAAAARSTIAWVAPVAAACTASGPSAPRPIAAPATSRATSQTAIPTASAASRAITRPRATSARAAPEPTSRPRWPDSAPREIAVAPSVSASVRPPTSSSEAEPDRKESSRTLAVVAGGDGGDEHRGEHAGGHHPQVPGAPGDGGGLEPDEAAQPCDHVGRPSTSVIVRPSFAGNPPGSCVATMHRGAPLPRAGELPFRLDELPRVVEHEQLRVARERAGQRGTPHLLDLERANRATLGRETRPRQRVLGDLGRGAADPNRADEPDDLPRRVPLEERPALGRISDPSLHRDVAGMPAEHHDLTGRPGEAEQGSQDARLPRAAVSGDDEALAAGEVEGHALHCGLATPLVDDLDVSRAYRGRGISQAVRG